MPLPRVTAKQIRYLALEGGGGKGNAFAGALRALADPRVGEDGQGILRFERYRPVSLKGFSGASAGAITSCMLSCGFDGEEIIAIMRGQNFDDFFDPLRPGYVPAVGRFVEKPKESVNRELLALVSSLCKLQTGIVSMRDLARIFGELGRFELQRFGSIIGGLLAVFPTLAKQLPAAARVIGGNVEAAGLSLVQDFGIFPGEAARRFIHKWVSIGAVRATSPQWMAQIPGWDHVAGDSVEARRQRIHLLSEHWGRDGSKFPINHALSGMTFEEHQRTFGVKLAVTGTELETLKTHVFSANTTPQFLVEDAVRISMSLPGVFKPYVIRGADAERASRGAIASLEGVWVDGGLLNNLPLRVFDNEPGDNPKTLGLRLGLEERTRIDTLGDLLSVWPVSLGFLGSGESQTSFTLDNYDASVLLDPSPLGLLDFSASDSVLADVHRSAFNATLSYFR
ncbi:MAG: patatin-like phospholipase family protein [Myxococcales bacterium]